jgi:class 3 adenylate cyclase
MRELPRGTVTFVFTDIEDSTRLLHKLGEERYASCSQSTLASRNAVSKHGGADVDTQGDQFFVAFEKASDAIAAAREVQAAVADGLARVRIGVHTGEPVVTEEGYIGVDVHRAARIMAAGHGRQPLFRRAVVTT